MTCCSSFLTIPFPFKITIFPRWLGKIGELTKSELLEGVWSKFSNILGNSYKYNKSGGLIACWMKEAMEYTE